MHRMILVLVAAAACSAPARSPAAPERSGTGFATQLSAAFAAHDPSAVGGLVTDDAIVVLIGNATERRGRAAVEADARAIFARFTRPHLAIGRTWTSPSVTIGEVVFSGVMASGDFLGSPIAEREIGVAGAYVALLDAAGRAKTLRLYVDLVTIIGQVDPKRLPAGAEIRPVVHDVSAGAAIVEAHGTAMEAENLARANTIWAALDAHDAAEVMAPASDDYAYVDFAAPRTLSKADTQKMVAGFLGAIRDFKIAAKPVQIAAGDDVITEMVETATFHGQPITLHGLDIKQFAGGKVVAEWQYSNYVEILRQVLGIAIPDLP